MRQPILRLAFCACLASAILAGPARRVPSVCAAGEPKACEMVIDALEAATKLKVGMLRADVEKDFEVDGGISIRDRGAYTYRPCHYIKINIEFKLRENAPGVYAPSPNDEVSKISSPYLAYPVSD